MTRKMQAFAGYALAPVLAALAAAPAPADEAAFTRTIDDPSLKWGPCPALMPEGCRIAVLNGDPSERNADIFYQVPGGAEIPRHWHTSPERMALVSGEMEVTYDGQDPVRLETGAYAYGPAKKPHSAVCLSADPCTLFVAFVDPIDAMEGAPQ